MSEDRPSASSRVEVSAYRHEMIYDGERRHGYADHLVDFLPNLIDGYAELTGAGERTEARIRHAAGVRASWQAEVNLAFGTEGCTPEQILVLTSDQAPVVLRTWSAPVPLLLVDSCYEPTTELPRPVAEEPGEIFWLEPMDELAYLLSLDVLDIVMLVDHLGGSDHSSAFLTASDEPVDPICGCLPQNTPSAAASARLASCPHS